MQRKIAFTVLVLGLASMQRGYGEAPTGVPPSPEPIQAWIAQLKSTDPLERRRAPRSPISLGSYRHAAALALTKALSSSDSFVRRRVADVIGEYQLEPALTVPPLARALGDSDTPVRDHAAIALIKIGPPAVPILVPIIRIMRPVAFGRKNTDETPRPSQQAYTAYVLSKIEPAAAQAILRARLDRDDLNPYEAYVVHSQPRAEAEVYRGILVSASVRVRKMALDELEYLSDDAAVAVPDLIRLLKVGRPAEREASAKILGGLGGQSAPAVPALIAALQGSLGELGKDAGQALGEIHLQPEVTVPALIAALDRAAASQKWWAIEALSSFGPHAAEACPRVRAALGNPSVDQNIVFSAISSVCPTDEETINVLLPLATSNDSGDKAIASLVRLGPAALSSVVDLYHRGNSQVRLNVIEALDDDGAPAPVSVSLFSEAISDSDAAVQMSALRALSRIGTGATSALPALLREYHARRNMYSIQCALKALGPAASSAFPELAAVAADEGTLKAAEQIPEHSFDDDCSVGDVLAAIGTASVPILVLLLEKPYFSKSAFYALAVLGAKPDEAAPAVAGLLPQHELTEQAAQFLATSGPNGLLQIEDALRNPDETIRGRAIDALKNSRSCAERVALIEPLLHDLDPNVRISAGWGIRGCPGTEAEIAKLREDPVENVRAALADRAEPDPFDVFVNQSRPNNSSPYQFAQKVGARAPEYVPRVRALLASPDEELAMDATRTLDEMGHAEDSKEFRSLALDAFLSSYMDDVMRRVQGVTDFHWMTKSAGPPPRQLPELPWPVLSPSRLELVRKPLFGSEVHSLGDVYAMLDTALSKVGFTETGIFAVPGGIAVVTPVERIREEDMTPFPEPDRWTRGKLPLKEFSLSDYLRSLFLDRPGQFRMFIFLISDRDPEISKTAMTEEQARSLGLEGGKVLPDSVAAESFADKQCFVLVYHFERTIGGDAAELAPSPFPVRKHLQSVGLTQFAP